MLDKLNKIKWSQLPTMAINTHNELSCNNSKFENLQKKIVKLFFFFFVDNSIYSSFLFINFFFHLSFLMTSLNKIPIAATALSLKISQTRLRLNASIAHLPRCDGNTRLKVRYKFISSAQIFLHLNKNCWLSLHII